MCRATVLRACHRWWSSPVLIAETRLGLYAHLTHQFIDKFPLDDANAFKSDVARMLNATLGFRKTLAKRWTLDAYLSGDNLLDQTYSLGYDLKRFWRPVLQCRPRAGILRVVYGWRFGGK